MTDSAPVISRDTADAIATRLLELSGKPTMGVLLEHHACSLTRLSHERVLTGLTGNTLSLRLDTMFGSGLPVVVGTNQLDDDLLRRALRQMESSVPVVPELPDDPTDDKYFTYQAREFLPVSLWHERTAAALGTTESEAAAPALIHQLQTAKLMGAATVGVTARMAFYKYKLGLAAYCRETDSELSVSVRLPDQRASGWAGQASRDWGTIQPTQAMDRAIELAQRGRGVTALEPGRRTAILGPAAVAQLIVAMWRMFDAYMSDIGWTPFRGKDGRKNLIGQRLFDPRLRMVSDPADPMGGFAPFFEADGQNLAGFPIGKTTWLEQGILTNLAYSTGYASTRGKTPSPLPRSVRLDGGNASVEDMIRNCSDGIYVNRFSNVQVVDEKNGIVAGVTRDGCFHVKDGVLGPPIKNFRFIETPVTVLDRVEMVGAPERVALGFTARRSYEAWEGTDLWPPMGGDAHWPRPPVIVPPLMIRDFNFVGLSDSV